MKKSNLTKKEKDILKILFQHRRWMSIRELADKANMSRQTMRTYIKKLKDKGWVEED